jgi:hypothetical protein
VGAISAGTAAIIAAGAIRAIATGANGPLAQFATRSPGAATESPRRVVACSGLGL